ncbi:DUF334 domain-containing protein [Staphylococcus aureus]
MTFIWYIAYGLPYIVAIGGFIYLYEWIRKNSKSFSKDKHAIMPRKSICR